MKITENTKLEIGTLLKDNEGYSIVVDYDKQNDCYILVECDEFILTMFNQYGISIFEELEDEVFVDELIALQVEDLIKLGEEIVETKASEMKIIGKFNKDKRYTIVEIDGELFALFNLKKDGTYEEKHECKEFATGLYGIGSKLD